jgi:hypothetical protein
MQARPQPSQPVDADMFAGTPFAAPAPAQPAPLGACMTFEGTLLRHAELRSKPARDGLHSVPVVCVEVRSLAGSTKQCHAEICFEDGNRHQAEALAKTLTKGRTVTVTAPLAHMRITFTQALSIEIHQEQ